MHAVSFPYDLKSLWTIRAVTLTFNNNLDKPLELYWVDYKGKSQYSARMEPNYPISFSTYTTWPYLIVDPKYDEVIGIYIPLGGVAAEISIGQVREYFIIVAQYNHA